MMLLRFLRFVRIAFRDFIFPPVCVGCGEHEVESGLVCTQCLDALGRYSPPHQMADDSEISHIRALGHYAPPFSSLVHELKYRNRTTLAPILGKNLSALLLSDAELRRGELLVPIPLHPARLRERGYNQSELLADQVSRLTRIPVRRALKRLRNTRSQVSLDDAARKKNMEGAFGVRPDAAVKGRSVILVDDVTTTGATLESAAKTLKQAGARVVFALVVAQAKS